MQGVKIMSTKTFLLWIPLLLQVGSFFFGNGTTYSDEVLCETKDHYQLKYHVYHSRQILHKFQLEIICKKIIFNKTHLSSDLRQSYKWNFCGGAGGGAEGNDDPGNALNHMKQFYKIVFSHI